MANDNSYLNEEKNENEKSTGESTSEAKQTSTTESQTEDRFPKWDILPPNQFINPRLKKKE